MVEAVNPLQLSGCFVFFSVSLVFACFCFVSALDQIIALEASAFFFDRRLCLPYCMACLFIMSLCIAQPLKPKKIF